MFAALVIRELRAGRLWAGLFLSLLLTYVLALAGHRLLWEKMRDVAEWIIPRFSGLPLIEGPFFTWFSVIVISFAVLLGLFQTLREQVRGTWQFLLHRPVPRPVIALAKLTAGLILYGAVGLIPLLVLTAFSASPGHFPGPFRWTMLEPELVALGQGLLFYLGAFLTGIRPARWFGSRLAGLAIALTVGLIANNQSTLAPALLLEALAAIVLGWAAIVALCEREY